MAETLYLGFMPVTKPASTTVEAKSAVPLTGIEKDRFIRGFRQVVDSKDPGVTEGPLLQAAQEFAADDSQRFADEDGMAEVFASDEYALGLVMGIARRRQQTERIEGADNV